MQSTKVQQPRLWFAWVSVSITKVGFVGTFFTTRSQCVVRSQSSVALLPVHVWRGKTFITRIDYPCLLDDEKVNLVSAVCRKKPWVHVMFRVVSGRLRWLSSCNFISAIAQFYKATDLCRPATATSFIVTMFIMYVQNDFRYMRCD